MSRWVLLPSASHKRPGWTEWIYKWKGKTYENMVSMNILHHQHHPAPSNIIIQHSRRPLSTSPNQVSNCQHFVQESLQELARRLSGLGLMGWYIWIRLQRFSHWDILFEWTLHAFRCAVLRGHIQATGAAKAERVEQIGRVLLGAMYSPTFFEGNL